MNKIKDNLIVAGNWKMNKTPLESRLFIENLIPKINGLNCDIVIFGSYLILENAINISKNYNLKIGAQNFYFEAYGAYTGEISAEMLINIGVKTSLIGHSERRKFFNETNPSINRKIKKAVSIGINVTLCVGESLEERHSSKHKEIIKTQISDALSNIHYKSLSKITVAYEPIWAIGTGEIATPEQANEMCFFIKECIKNIYNLNEELTIKVLYGGSITSKNCKEIFLMPYIDGGLVGGASLDYNEFYSIVKTADDIIKGDVL